MVFQQPPTVAVVAPAWPSNVTIPGRGNAAHNVSMAFSGGGFKTVETLPDGRENPRGQLVTGQFFPFDKLRVEDVRDGLPTDGKRPQCFPTHTERVCCGRPVSSALNVFAWLFERLLNLLTGFLGAPCEPSRSLLCQLSTPSHQ
jgi:hypothetical protein